MKLRLPTHVQFRIPFRLRVFFRGVFLLLTLATVALAISVLREEKQRSYRAYEDGFRKNHAQIVARLRHPTGQLALLNPSAVNRSVTPLRPLVLPFSAIDFDDKNKAQQAIEMAGCLIQYPDAASLCVAVGNNPYAGGFIYVAGSFASGELVAHKPGELDLTVAHRVRVEVTMRGETSRWIAPLQLIGEVSTNPSVNPTVRARLTGFIDNGPITPASRPVRDFRGWLWQDGSCFAGDNRDSDHCLKRAFVSIRLPIELFRLALINKSGVVWPPADLDDILVRMEVLPPGEGSPIFDSNAAGASLPFSWAELSSLLLPGEQLLIRNAAAPAEAKSLVSLVGATDSALPPHGLERLVRALPLDEEVKPLSVRDTISTQLGRYEVTLLGEARTVNRNVAEAAARLMWLVLAMLAAIMLAWFAIEVRIIRRITTLTKRAASVSSSVRAADDLARIDLSDLRGSDELGVLARGLQDLVRRVKEDVKREQIRADQEKDTWHAVGHEIMSPLQSLMVLHPDASDASHRYVSRMQQAIRVLYGSASPSEALQSTALQIQDIDINEFLVQVAANAEGAGIGRVSYAPLAQAMIVRADEYALEDVVTHVLRNAERYRPAGTAIRVGLRGDATDAEVSIHNVGAPIASEMIDKIFEYGVSDATRTDGSPQRGQGLFVAKTYLSKMGGTISARNVSDGVEFLIRLPYASGHPQGVR
jgi:signal transduction histidine kinase